MRYKDGSELCAELFGWGAIFAMAGNCTPGIPDLLMMVDSTKECYDC